MGLERVQGTTQGIRPKAVLDVDDAYALNPQGVQMRDGLFDLLLVGCAHVEDMAAHWLVQCHCPGGGAHQHHAGLVEQRHNALRVRGAPGHEERDGAMFFDEGPGVFQRQLGVELVVQHHQFDLLAAHTALGVDGIQIKGRALHGLFHSDGCRAGDAHCLPDDDLRPAEAH
ncbi:MAG: hypothetical protein ACD_23C00593G0002 [uncultured bacterium]|nr:MAG: hypothetical protein ACD_23C00593G0002 [uncultured bacterium]